MDSVKSHLIFHISKEAIAKEMFDTLKNVFEHDSSSKSITLRTQLHTIKMKRMCRLTAKLLKALVHVTIIPIELWHKRLAHLHYIALPTLRNVSIGFPEFGDQHNRVCHGCYLGKNDKRLF